MANNRIYLRCKGCGATLFLGKSYMAGYYYEDYDEKPLKDKLNDFYSKHNYCTCEKADEPFFYDENAFPFPRGFEGCDGAFDIVYENTEGTGLEGTANETD